MEWFFRSLYSPLRAGPWSWAPVLFGLWATSRVVDDVGPGGPAAAPVRPLVDCLRHEPFEVCRRRGAKLGHLDDAMQPLRRVDATDLTDAVRASSYAADDGSEWALIRRPDAGTFLLERLVRLDPDVAVLRTPAGVVDVALGPRDSVTALGVSGDQRPFLQVYPRLAYTVLFVVLGLASLLGPLGPLVLGRIGPSATDADLSLRRSLTVISPINGHRLHQRAHLLSLVTLPIALAVWVPLVAVAVWDPEDGPRLWPSLLGLPAVALCVVALKDVVEVLSGIDFDVRRVLRDARRAERPDLTDDEATPTPPDPTLAAWLDLKDLRTIQAFERSDTVGAMLTLGYRSPGPVFHGWPVDHDAYRARNQEILARVLRLERQGFLTWVGGDLDVTELGLRARALPEFYIHPRYPEALQRWLAEVEHAMGRPGRSVEAVVVLMVNLERALKRASLALLDGAPQPERLLRQIRAGDDRRVSDDEWQPLLDGDDPWLPWAETQAGDGIAPGALRSALRGLTRSGWWTLRFEPAIAEAGKLRALLHPDLRRPPTGESMADALATLVRLRRERPWPSALERVGPADVERARPDVERLTLRPLSEIVLEQARVAKGDPLRAMFDRLIQLRNDRFHDKRDRSMSASDDELKLAYEAAWLARPLLFRLHELLRDRVPEAVWLDPDPVRAGSQRAEFVGT
jgi:hypothetical protein